MENNYLKLADIPTGEECVIVKVHGHGSFRNRIVEMGFVKGEKVTVIKNAPLHDPIEYKLMDGHISLRRSEARLIEVVCTSSIDQEGYNGTFTEDEIAREISEKSRTINIALVGNPNCGKTSFFNRATGLRERVGNYSGVTVDAKQGTCHHKGYTINLIDLPGTYSITEYTPEEIYVREFITKHHPDLVLNVVDASCLERNLFLTTQLIDMNIRVVMALNMFDELTNEGSHLDYGYLGQLLGIPIVPTTASKGIGIEAVLDKIIEVFEDQAKESRHVHINYGTEIEEAIARIKVEIAPNKNITDEYAPRYVAIKLLEDDRIMKEQLVTVPNYACMLEVAQKEIQRLVNGVIAGVGGVIVFLPNILILFFFISLMEDTGYMARAAFIMDRMMHKIGLHGKSFIPLLIGFGCNVPAIMATRTLESRRDRIMTMLITPFMSCSARLPVYILLVSAFFPVNQGLILLSVYLIGILLAIGTSFLLKKTLFAKSSDPFVMELPPYRMPTMRNTTIHMWGKAGQYLKKMGTIILFASILIWALGYFPLNRTTMADETEHLENSYIGQIGKAIEPVIRPLGFDWKMGVSIVTGLAAKEIVVSSMGILYHVPDAEENSQSLIESLQQQQYSNGQKVFTPLVAYGFMLFILIYFPCMAVIAAIRKEAGWKWALFTIFYTTGLAWLVSFGVYQIGSLF